MDRNKALKIFDYLQSLSDKFYLAGSVRRGKTEDLHDLDVIYVGEETPVIPGHTPFVKGKDIIRVTILGEHVDIYRTDPEYFGGMYFFLTGPQGFNIMTRGRAKKKGYLLNQKGLFKRATMEPIATATEEAIFDALGMKYIEPTERRIPSWLAKAMEAKKSEEKEVTPF